MDAFDDHVYEITENIEGLEEVEDFDHTHEDQEGAAHDHIGLNVFVSLEYLAMVGEEPVLWLHNFSVREVGRDREHDAFQDILRVQGGQAFE